MNKSLKFSIIFLFAIGTFTTGQAQTGTVKEVQSVMLFSFLKYFEWPAQFKDDHFVIGVYGDNDVHEILDKRYHNSMRSGKKVLIKNLSGYQEAHGCHMVYIGKSKSKDFDKLKGIIDRKPILLVSNTKGLGTKGSGINFKEVDNKIHFELNTDVIAQSKLKVSSRLANLAILL